MYKLLSDIHAAERLDDLEKKTLGIITIIYAFTIFIINGSLIAFKYVIDIDGNDILKKLHPFYVSFYVFYYCGLELFSSIEIVIFIFM